MNYGGVTVTVYQKKNSIPLAEPKTLRYQQSALEILTYVWTVEIL